MAADGEYAAEGFVDQFLDLVCKFEPLLRALLPIEILFVILAATAFTLNPPESAGRVVLYLTLPANVVVLAATAGLLYACGSRYR